MSGFGVGAAPPSRNIYVAGLPAGLEDSRLKEVFAAYGEVVWAKVLRDGRDGRTPGIVEFSNLEHATWVVANVNGGIPQGLSDPVDIKFKDEKGASGGGYGPAAGGKGGMRPSPYGPPDSTRYDGSEGDGGFGGFPGQPPPPCGRPPAADPGPSDNVYVKGLPLDADDALLKQVFSAYGTVIQCRLCPGGEARKTALVRFTCVEEAQNCISACSSGQIPSGLTEQLQVRFAETWDTKQRMHNHHSDGTDFSIEVIVKGFESSGLMPGGMSRYDNNSTCALYIAGLPSDTTDLHLFRMFSPLGPIAPRGVRALLNDDGSCKGIAFVNFQRDTSVSQAVSLYNGALLADGTKLKVQRKQPRPQPHVCTPPGGAMGASAPARIVLPPMGAPGAADGGFSTGGDASQPSDTASAFDGFGAVPLTA